jgi:hypothetical protein
MLWVVDGMRLSKDYRRFFTLPTLRTLEYPTLLSEFLPSNIFPSFGKWLGRKAPVFFCWENSLFCKLPYLEQGTGNSLVFHIDKKTFFDIIFYNLSAKLDFEKILRSDPDFRFRRTQ